MQIDFNKNWLRVVCQNKLNWSLIIISTIIINIFSTLIPTMIGIIIAKQNFMYVNLLALALLGCEAITLITNFLYSTLSTQIIQSVWYSAYKFFLTIDPVYHTTKSSGAIYSKIDRCSRSYKYFFEYMIAKLLPIVISVITISLSFLSVDFNLGVIALLLLIFIIILNIGLVLLTTKSFESNIIKADDSIKADTVESLNQIHMIRSCFSTDEWNSRLLKKNKNMIHQQGAYWIAFDTVSFITKTVYLISIVILCGLIFNLIKLEAISSTLGVSLLVTYIHGTKKLLRIGWIIHKLTQCIIRIEDIFTFIQNFGKQTFPVLTEDIRGDYEFLQNSR